MLPFIYACIGFFAFDHLMRILKSRITTAIIHPIPELDSTRVEISKYNAGWRAGQHVRLRVLSSGMGWVGWAEVHPFTIASVGRGQEGVVLICKKRGTWTKSLYDLAKLGGYTKGENGRKITVVVEGPYG
jgi:predicted ferric reductase